MPRTILIPEPNLFYSTHDEDVFFGWLYALPGFISVIGKPEGLYLTMKSFNKEIILELIAMMRRYKLDMKSLEQLCNANNEKWFKDENMSWYKPIFRK
jgi:hypothetical protein